MSRQTNVTRILSQIQSGDLAASDELLPLVYDELRKLASAKLAGEKPEPVQGVWRREQVANQTQAVATCS